LYSELPLKLPAITLVYCRWKTGVEGEW